MWASRFHARSPAAVGLLIRFLFIGSRLCSTLLSDPASRRSPCASLSLLLHQDGKRTFTSQLLNMLGTHENGGAAHRVVDNLAVVLHRLRDARLRNNDVEVVGIQFQGLVAVLQCLRRVAY